MADMHSMVDYCCWPWSLAQMEAAPKATTMLPFGDHIHIELEKLFAQLENHALRPYSLTLGTVYPLHINNYLGNLKLTLENNPSICSLSFCASGLFGVIGSVWDSKTLSFFEFLKLNSTLHSLDLESCNIDDGVMENIMFLFEIEPFIDVP
jgi:hypothetical protein